MVIIFSYRLHIKRFWSINYICKKQPLKHRYFIFISYRGTAYHGWQVQPNSLTVQEILDRSLSQILREEISTTGAGRTDAGVHALVFCAHFDSAAVNLDSDEQLIFRLNRFLPKDITVTHIRHVIKDANARFNALSRTYIYYISLSKDPFSLESSWFLHGSLDIDKMNTAADILFRYRDFTSFSKLHTDVKTNDCRIMEAFWKDQGDKLVFTIKADRFLRNMVRSIVGTMVDIGFGKKSLDEFEKIIQAKNRRMAGFSAPAKGLYLTAIDYPDNIFVRKL